MKPTIAIMSPGDMGHAVGAVLRQAGLRVITQLDGRSERTRALAARAGIEQVADDDILVRAADILLSILVPAEALALAERIAGAVRGTGATPLYVDCNAIAPQTARQVAEIVEGAGARFVDAGIIGPPPQSGATSTRFYASGGDAATFARLKDFGLDVRVVGDRPGQASALKMCYAALTKGTTALMTELSIAAERLGVSDALRAEFAREPAGHARAHAARGAGDGAQGAPLGRRDGGDREDLRGVRPDPAHLRRRGRALCPGRRHRPRPHLAGRLARTGRTVR